MFRGHPVIPGSASGLGMESNLEITAPSAADFATIEPKILYFGTPVALVSSVNEDGSIEILAPISSFWALGWT